MHNSTMLSFTLGVAFKKTTLVLRALGHPLRIGMLNFIGQTQPVKVNSIYKELSLEQPIASQHLKVLRDADLVLFERRGKEVYYSLDIDNLKKVAALVNNYFGKK